MTFPNANYWVSKEEWEYWLKTEAPFGNSDVNDYFVNRVMNPLKGVIKFIEDGQQMAPYLTAHKVPGHTPGLSILKLETEEKFYGLLQIYFIQLYKLLKEIGMQYLISII